MTSQPDPTALYVHVPFCRAKCGYCDFNSYSGQEALFERYAAALVRDLRQARPARVETLYLGGGTPTVLPLGLLEQVMAAAGPAGEVSMEANPGTVDAGGLAALRVLGVNRLSLGVQSLDDAELRVLGRIHTAAEAVEAYRAARAAGLDDVNLDLMYGLPGQSVERWRATLEQALDLEPDHLSLYALTVEDGTPLAARIARGRLPEPDPDAAADMYELAETLLAAAGYVHYEISNWARRPAAMCPHNLVYWRNEPYVGVGAGAHSWAGGRRQAAVASPAEYTRRVLAGDSAVESEEEIGPEMEMGETMMLGLRLLEEGVSFERFQARFGRDLRRHYAAQLAELDGLGLIVAGPDRVTLSARGHLLGNRAFGAFLPEPGSESWR